MCVCVHSCTTHASYVMHRSSASLSGSGDGGDGPGAPDVIDRLVHQACGHIPGATVHVQPVIRKLAGNVCLGTFHIGRVDSVPGSQSPGGKSCYRITLCFEEPYFTLSPPLVRGIAAAIPPTMRIKGPDGAGVHADSEDGSKVYVWLRMPDMADEDYIADAHEASLADSACTTMASVVNGAGGGGGGSTSRHRLRKIPIKAGALVATSSTRRRIPPPPPPTPPSPPPSSHISPVHDAGSVRPRPRPRSTAETTHSKAFEASRARLSSLLHMRQGGGGDNGARLHPDERDSPPHRRILDLRRAADDGDDGGIIAMGSRRRAEKSFPRATLRPRPSISKTLRAGGRRQRKRGRQRRDVRLVIGGNGDDDDDDGASGDEVDILEDALGMGGGGDGDDLSVATTAPYVTAHIGQEPSAPLAGSGYSRVLADIRTKRARKSAPPAKSIPGGPVSTFMAARATIGTNSTRNVAGGGGRFKTQEQLRAERRSKEAAEEARTGIPASRPMTTVMPPPPPSSSAQSNAMKRTPPPRRSGPPRRRRLPQRRRAAVRRYGRGE